MGAELLWGWKGGGGGGGGEGEGVERWRGRERGREYMYSKAVIRQSIVRIYVSIDVHTCKGTTLITLQITYVY